MINKRVFREVLHLHEVINILKECLKKEMSYAEIRGKMADLVYLKDPVIKFFEMAYSKEDLFKHIVDDGITKYKPDNNHKDLSLLPFDQFLKEFKVYAPDSGTKHVRQRIKYVSGLECLCKEDAALFYRLLHNNYKDKILTPNVLRQIFLDIRLPWKRKLWIRGILTIGFIRIREYIARNFLYLTDEEYEKDRGFILKYLSFIGK